MLPAADTVQDVMQVCRNGHVVTDLLRTHPDGGRDRCDRCGAATLERCPTCGRDLPGALATPFRPVGSRQPPAYCAGCGAAFPWTSRSAPGSVPEPLARLEGLLRRVPRVARELRVRHGDRAPFRVADDRDLEDLVRALLPVHFDDIRPECRTPPYAAVTRTDFVLAPERIVLTAKCARPGQGGPELARQLEEDVAYYRGQPLCATLVCFVYDPEGLLRHFTAPEPDPAAPDGPVTVHWLVGAP
jgi:hypothetical protein